MATYAVDLTFTDGCGQVHHSLYKNIKDFLDPKPVNYVCPELTVPRVEPDDDAKYINASIQSGMTSFWRRYSSIQELRELCAGISVNKYSQKKEASPECASGASLKYGPVSAILG